MDSFDTYKVGIIDNNGNNVLFSRLDISFQLNHEVVFQHLYCRKMDTSVLCMDSTEIIRYFFGCAKENRKLLREHLLRQGWYYFIFDNQAIEIRMVTDQESFKKVLVCYFWKEASKKEIRYPPSTLYYIDEATFPSNYEHIMEMKRNNLSSSNVQI